MFFFTSLKNRKIETHLPPYSRGSFKDVCVCVGGGGGTLKEFAVVSACSFL